MRGFDTLVLRNIVTIPSLSLSAHLWESTGNVTYLNAANLSATFMQTNMYSPLDQVMMDKCVDIPFVHGRYRG